MNVLLLQIKMVRIQIRKIIKKFSIILNIISLVKEE